MSKLTRPLPVKSVTAILYSDRGSSVKAIERIEQVLGRLDYASLEFLHDQSQYYRSETGWPLYKRLLALEDLIDPGRLVETKLKCLELEAEFSVGGKRRVNIDPGYLTADKLVLATGKASASRIYLDRGVWADLTLLYQHGGFQPLPWTYPDYASEPLKAALRDIRKKYLFQLRMKPQEEE